MGYPYYDEVPLTPLVDAQIGKHHQGWDYNALYDVNDRLVSVDVHHDTSTTSQSRAKVAVWANDTWSPIAYAHYHQWAHDPEHPDRAVGGRSGPGMEVAEFGTLGIETAVSLLLRQAWYVLGPKVADDGTTPRGTKRVTDYQWATAMAVAGGLPWDMWREIGRRFTCDEATVISDFLRGWGSQEAEAFEFGHASYDEDDTDRHRVEGECTHCGVMIGHQGNDPDKPMVHRPWPCTEDLEYVKCQGEGTEATL